MECKKKGCKNPAVNGRKYCNHHQAEIDSRYRNIAGIAAAAGSLAVLVMKGRSR